MRRRSIKRGLRKLTTPRKTVVSQAEQQAGKPYYDDWWKEQAVGRRRRDIPAEIIK